VLVDGRSATKRKAAPVPLPFPNQLPELASDTQGIARRREGQVLGCATVRNSRLKL